MNNIQNIIIFSGHQDFSSKVREKLVSDDITFTDCNDLKVCFNLVASSSFDVLIFETYEYIEEVYHGINAHDLELLLNYCASEKSSNRYMRFLPIERESAEASKAEQIYEPIYEINLLLLPPANLKDIALESLLVDEARKMLFELVGTLDTACVHFDEKSTRIKGQVDEDESFSRVSGELEEDQSFSRVSGQLEEEDQSFSRVSGQLEEDQSFSRVSGQLEEEDQSFSRVSGELEEDESFSRISGELEEEDQSFSRVSGELEEEDQSFTRISGSQNKAEKEFNTVFTADTEENSSEVHYFNNKTAKQQEQDTMQIKHIDPKESQSNSSDPKDKQHHIDTRNSHGQTPLMLYCLKGEKDKAMELIHSGANTSLKCKKGLTILHYACAHPNSLEVAKYLVDIDKLRLSARDSDGLDPLAIAIKRDCPETIKWLTAEGARTTSKISGQPLLHFAAAHNSFQSFLVLLSLGLPLNQKCNLGLSLEDYCKKKKRISFLKALKAYSILNTKKEAA